MGKRAVFLALDNSGSMAGFRAEAMKVALASLYQRIAEFLNVPGNSMDLAICLWGSTETTRVYRNVDSVGMSFALSRLTEVDAGMGGTDFSVLAPSALSFFEGTLGEEYESRKFVFLTDGQPTPTDTATTAALLLDDLLDQDTGDFNTVDGTQVDCHAANIDQITLTWTSLLDNTAQDGVPIISVSNNRALAAYLRAIVLPVETHRLWTFPYQWSVGATEELAFRTEIIVSRDGTEQRIAQRVKPRATYTFQSLLTKDQAKAPARRAGHRQAERYFIPHPHQTVKLAAPVAASGSSLVIDRTPPSWVTPGNYIVLNGASGDGALAAIVRVSGTTVSLATAIGQDFPVGATARQAVEGRFAGENEVVYVTNKTAQLSTNFEADPVLNFVPEYGEPESTIDGVEFFDMPPNWSGSVTFSFAQEAEIFDEGRGAVDAYYPVAHTTRLAKMRFLCETPEKLDKLLGVFHRSKGRRDRFYAPLWVDEVSILGSALSGAESLTVQGREFFDTFGPYLSYRRILIRRKVGADLLLRITDVVVDGAGNSVLNLSVPLATDLVSSDIQSVMWVCPVRFASDRLTIEWRVDGIAEIEVNLSTLEETDVV